MFEQIQEFVLTNQEYFITGAGSFAGWLGFNWIKGRLGAWWRGDNLPVSQDILDVIEFLRANEKEVVETPKIQINNSYLVWENKIKIYIYGSEYVSGPRVNLCSPSHSINMNKREKYVILEILKQLTQKKESFNKNKALQELKYPMKVVEIPQPTPPPPPACKFKLGDVVKLKSGGPDMTIYRLEWDEEQKTWVGKCSYYCEQKHGFKDVKDCREFELNLVNNQENINKMLKRINGDVPDVLGFPIGRHGEYQPSQ